jgi:hypothetical protein
MKPDFQKVFWIVHNEMFKPKLNKDWIDKKTEDDLAYVYYQKVIPVYVKCVSDMYDGTTQFDITPVDVRGSNQKNHWQWSRSISDDAIGKTVFETEEEAQKYFEATYSEKQRTEFEEKDNFRRMQR